MQWVTVSNLDNILIPRAGDAGYDLIASSDPVIVGKNISVYSPLYEHIDYIEYEVDLEIAPPEGFFSMVFPRSSISKYQLNLCNSVGVIDNEYRGKIIVRFNYLFSPRDFNGFLIKDDINFSIEVNQEKIYQKGDKIAQILFFPYHIFSLAKGNLSTTERGAGGFGSTDKDKQS